jgi:hypothetical protein
MELPEDLCNVNFELDRCFCQKKLKQVNSSSSKSENTIGDKHTHNTRYILEKPIALEHLR